MSIEKYLGMIDTFTVIGLIFGAICGGLAGHPYVFTKLVNSNLFGQKDLKDNPYNKLDSSTRWILGLVGGFFFIFGIIMLVVLFTTDFKPGTDDKIAVQTGAFAGIVIGGLVLVPAITGKRES